jgi:hypothetical protein
MNTIEEYKKQGFTIKSFSNQSELYRFLLELNTKYYDIQVHLLDHNNESIYKNTSFISRISDDYLVVKRKPIILFRDIKTFIYKVQPKKNISKSPLYKHYNDLSSSDDDEIDQFPEGTLIFEQT